jgi:hypothetical protein
VHALPVVAWYLPTGQSLHAVDSTDAYWPFSHVVQLIALYTLAYSPASHDTHSPTSRAGAAAAMQNLKPVA